ncbi:MAG: hypothetical protein LBL52_02155 [Rickettsiales bacterium]|nr:hypothetical protein [Rickettsiales bacterium]
MKNKLLPILIVLLAACDGVKYFSENDVGPCNPKKYDKMYPEYDYCERDGITPADGVLRYSTKTNAGVMTITVIYRNGYETSREIEYQDGSSDTFESGRFGIQ